ncbi:MAG: YcxB family protein [Geothrix sp.]|uniref:YcxB family protein n=1 Tax=Geothrix sp. TaxID=1962974 RepID=UPI0017EAFC26|nr:YcxB family protein [Geothrix sp.]NWJ41059.1 YcxB family protein [Geothrix sp.]WIL20948.1 MAG: YcxB family protein [Geothrix sp.]
MHITAHYSLTPDEALRGTRAFKRLWYGLSVGSGALMVLMGYTTLQATQDHRGLPLIMLVNGLLFLVLPEAVLRWARLRRGAQAYPPMQVTLDDEGLTLRTETSEGGLPWASFAEIQRHSGFWIFRISRSQAVLVPERALDEAAVTELAAFLRERKLFRG